MVMLMNLKRDKTCSSGDTKSDLDFEIAFYESIIDKDPTYVDALTLLGEAYIRQGRFEDGLRIDKMITALRPSDPIAFYNLACSYSLIRKNKEAITNLRKSIALGYDDLEHIAGDGDLASLHTDSSFLHLIRALCKKIIREVKRRRAW